MFQPFFVSFYNFTHASCFLCFKILGAPTVESIQPFTIYDYPGMFYILEELHYLLQLYQSPSAGGNISNETLWNQLNQINFKRSGFVRIRYRWTTPGTSLRIGIQGG